MRHRLCLAATMLLIGLFVAAAVPVMASTSSTVALAAAPTASTRADAQIRGAIVRAIAPDTGRGAIRLPTVTLNDSGDLTVVVALREQDDLDAFRAATEEDVFRILRAVYATPNSPVKTATVVGTYSVTDNGSARELPVLRAVLSADHASGIRWESAKPQDLFTAADTYRLYPPFGDAQEQPIAPTEVSAATTAGAADPVISSPVNIGGGRLIFLRCIGSGSPTVILEAGYGDNGEIWAPVQIHASEFVRICSYDRAGLERSDPPGHYPRIGAEVVTDLHAALQKDDVKGPYLLVGHSYGALFSRLFAATYPDEVAGMILLDPWPVDYNSLLQKMVTTKQWSDYESLLAADPDNEVIDFPATYKQIQAAGSLPDVPLLVLSHGQAPAAAGYPPGWPIAKQEQLWQKLEQGLAHLTPMGVERTVPGSGHMIHQAKPDVVVAAIHEMVEHLRGAT